jgi:hypothetical protein
MASAAQSGTRLKGKVAIVTGSSPIFPLRHPTWLTGHTGGGSGYGEGIAVRFASEGAKVIIADINDDGGARVAGIIPDNMAFFHANVAQAEDWAKLMEFATTTFGTVDILVNNAGASYRNKVCIGLTCWSHNIIFSPLE